jgi:hypothetical protein
MEKRRCGGCRKLFRLRPQIPGQKFCAAAACQRERKRRWQKARRAVDPDYWDNDIQANRQWRRHHPEYWRAYRGEHPQSVIGNRDKQRQRDRARGQEPPPPVAGGDLANEDASTLPFPLETGTYRLFPVTGNGLANEDVWLVKIALLSVG